jgi:hypothetical protein
MLVPISMLFRSLRNTVGSAATETSPNDSKVPAKRLKGLRKVYEQLRKGA